MSITIIRHNTNKIRLAKLQNCKETNNQFQPWHLQAFNDAATSGIELLFDNDDVTIDDEIVSPFQRLSDEFYCLETSLAISPPDGFNLLVVPHARFYTEDDFPLPLPCSWEADWFSKPFKFIFRKRGKAIFRKNEPYAQIIPIPRQEYKVCQFSNDQLDEWEKKKEYIESEKDKYITREWINSCGVKFDNVYENLVHRRKSGRLPDGLIPTKTRKFRIFPKHDAVGKNKKD